MPKGTTPVAHKGDAALQAGIAARKKTKDERQNSAY